MIIATPRTMNRQLCSEKNVENRFRSASPGESLFSNYVVAQLQIVCAMLLVT